MSRAAPPDPLAMGETVPSGAVASSAGASFQLNDTLVTAHRTNSKKTAAAAAYKVRLFSDPLLTQLQGGDDAPCAPAPSHPALTRF